jgi:hypothetical protein
LSGSNWSVTSRASPWRRGCGDQRGDGVRFEAGKRRGAGRDVVDDDLQVVGATVDAGLDERARFR